VCFIASNREDPVTTQGQDVVCATPPRRRIVGYNPGIAGFVACSVLGVFVFCWVLLASPPNDAGNLLNVLPPMSLIVAVLCLLGTCRLVVDPGGFIDVIEPLRVHRVPIGELVGVEHDQGLRLRVVSGRRIGSVAYGTSLLGVLVHYPRSVRAARRIEAAIGGLPDRGGLPAWQQDTVNTMLRIRGYLGTLAVVAVLVLGTVVLDVVERAAQH
jgi:hypothetical protein